MKFTIPTTTPPGKYLLRAEQMCPCQKGYGGSQSYIACAHIDIIGPGGGEYYLGTPANMLGVMLTAHIV